MKSLDNVGVQVDGLIAQLAALTDTGNRILAQARSPRSAIGALRSTGMPQLANAGAVASGLMNKATAGSGTLGLAMRGDATARLGKIMAQKDSLMLLVQSGNGSVGRFRRDSTLFTTVGDIRASVDTLRALVSNSQTPLARNDSTLSREIARVSAELALLMADIKKHPCDICRIKLSGAAFLITETAETAEQAQVRKRGGWDSAQDEDVGNQAS